MPTEQYDTNIIIERLIKEGRIAQAYAALYKKYEYDIKNTNLATELFETSIAPVIYSDDFNYDFWEYQKKENVELQKAILKKLESFNGTKSLKNPEYYNLFSSLITIYLIDSLFPISEKIESGYSFEKVYNELKREFASDFYLKNFLKYAFFKEALDPFENLGHLNSTSLRLAIEIAGGKDPSTSIRFLFTPEELEKMRKPIEFLYKIYRRNPESNNYVIFKKILQIYDNLAFNKPVSEEYLEEIGSERLYTFIIEYPVIFRLFLKNNPLTEEEEKTFNQLYNEAILTHIEGIRRFLSRYIDARIKKFGIHNVYAEEMNLVHFYDNLKRRLEKLTKVYGNTGERSLSDDILRYQIEIFDKAKRFKNKLLFFENPSIAKEVIFKTINDENETRPSRQLSNFVTSFVGTKLLTVVNKKMYLPFSTEDEFFVYNLWLKPSSANFFNGFISALLDYREEGSAERIKNYMEKLDKSSEVLVDLINRKLEESGSNQTLEQIIEEAENYITDGGKFTILSQIESFLLDKFSDKFKTYFKLFRILQINTVGLYRGYRKEDFNAIQGIIFPPEIQQKLRKVYSIVRENSDGPFNKDQDLETVISPFYSFKRFDDLSKIIEMLKLLTIRFWKEDEEFLRRYKSLTDDTARFLKAPKDPGNYDLAPIFLSISMEQIGFRGEYADGDLFIDVNLDYFRDRFEEEEKYNHLIGGTWQIHLPRAYAYSLFMKNILPRNLNNIEKARIIRNFLYNGIYGRFYRDYELEYFYSGIITYLREKDPKTYEKLKYSLINPGFPMDEEERNIFDFYVKPIRELLFRDYKYRDLNSPSLSRVFDQFKSRVEEVKDNK